MINREREQVTQECGFDVHIVQEQYFRDRWNYFQEVYKNEYPGGWAMFYAAYLNGCTDPANLDYDEWAFLCEHFMRDLTQSWQPPGNCSDFQEKPEANSGFSFVRQNRCSIRISISETSRMQLKVAGVG